MAYILLVYIIALFVFVIYSAAGIYHLLRFGYSGDLSRYITAFYVVLSLFIIAFSSFFIIINWQF